MTASLSIQTVTRADREWVRRFVKEHWGAETAIAHGVVYHPAELPGFIAVMGGARVGLVTYHIAGRECEIVTIDSTRPSSGIGTALIEAVAERARHARCRRLWLITTNDNLAALRFYQKRGFALVAVHRNALEASRKLKPQIPTIGHDDIPLRDEVELELPLPAPEPGPIDTVKTFVLKFANDWTMNLASMVAYSLITAIFPILLVVLSIVGLVLQTFGDANIDAVASAINRAFPTQGGFDVAALLRSLVTLTGPLAVAALIGLLWLGSNLFATIENAFSIIFRIRGRDLVRQRIMAVGMVLILAVLLPVSLGAASFVTAGSDNFRALLPHQAGLLLTFVGPLTSLGVLWLLFLSIYLVVPNIKVPFRYAWRGALTAAILFGLLQLLFPTYFKVFLQGNTRYGALAATLLVIIIWLWFFALITVIGAQINAVAMGLRSLPFDLARTVETVSAQQAPAAVESAAEMARRAERQPARTDN